MKTAREMFEDFNWIYSEIENALVYKKNDGNHRYEITFNLHHKFYVTECYYFNKINYFAVGKHVHKAITKQMQELGWLDDNNN